MLKYFLHISVGLFEYMKTPQGPHNPRDKEITIEGVVPGVPWRIHVGGMCEK